MIFIRKNKRPKRLGATRMSAQEDIAKLLSHDWSDPLLEEYFATVVEKLPSNAPPSPRCDDDQDECRPTSKGHGAR
jgi:hypothetical protein